MESVIGGVDTHSAVHCVAAVDTTGRLLGWAEFPASADGYEQLLTWLRHQGVFNAWGSKEPVPMGLVSLVSSVSTMSPPWR
jgi:hypothetical protein